MFQSARQFEKNQASKTVPISVGKSNANVKTKKKSAAAYYLDVLNLVAEYNMNDSSRLEAAT